MLEPSPSSLTQRCKALIAKPWFDVLIVCVILVNAVFIGLGTFEGLASRHHGLFTLVNNVVLVIYVIELLIRLTAFEWKPRDFAKDPWNVFDFIVVVASLVPWLRENAMILRMVRVLRIARVARFLPDLRVALGAIARSVPGVASLAAASVLLIYIYGMIGWVVFGQHDPENYGNIGRAMETMFVLLTLENLPDYIATGREVSEWSILFFVSYAVLASFLIFNLFIGIVLNSMEEARAADRKEHETDDLLERLRNARTALEDAERELQKTHRNDRGAPVEHVPAAEPS